MVLLDLWPSFAEQEQGLRKALALVLRTGGIETYATVPGVVTPPVAVIRRREGPIAEAFDDPRVGYVFVVTLLASIADESSGQVAISPHAVIAAIDADPTLGGVAEHAFVSDVEPDRIVGLGGLSYLGTDVVVDVAASETAALFIEEQPA